MEKKYNRSEIAVSEVVGFIIILGIMMTGIGLVTLYGYPALIQEQSNANIKNMERNMIVLQNDIESLTYKSVPYEETSMQVSGGVLSVENPATPPDKPYFTIYYTGNPDIEFRSGEIQFESSSQDAVVILENGAVIIRYWSDPTGSAMISEPRWYYDSPTKTFVIPLITVSSDVPLSQSGVGTVRMNITESPPEMYPHSGGTVSVAYDPDITNHHQTAWDNYFDKLGLPQSGVDKLIIKRYNVKILSL
jgi:hypothetical protein